MDRFCFSRDGHQNYALLLPWDWHPQQQSGNSQRTELGKHILGRMRASPIPKGCRLNLAPSPPWLVPDEVAFKESWWCSCHKPSLTQWDAHSWIVRCAKGVTHQMLDSLPLCLGCELAAHGHNIVLQNKNCPTRGKRQGAELCPPPWLSVQPSSYRG